MSISSTYMPVDPDFYDVIEDQKNQGMEIKIFFFSDNSELDSTTGKIEMIIHENRSEFLKLDNGDKVRLDRIITINGKPGPIYDYYESFSNACLDCRVDF
jgi:hypothetical protein